MVDPAGRVAVVTGGGTGIGRGIATALARAGATTVVLGRRRDRLDEVVAALAAESLDAHGIVADVVDAASLQAAADEIDRRWGRLDILVNNAGIGLGATVADGSLADWDLLIDVNLRGVVRGIQAFLPLIRRGGAGGHVVNTASMSGLVPIVAGPYSATKAAVIALSEALHIELLDEGIGVSAFCPGPTHSEIGGKPSDAGDDIPPYMSAEEIGERVVDGIRRGDLFLLTHPEFKPGLVARHRAIEDAFPDEPIDPVRGEAFGWLTMSPVYASDHRLPPPSRVNG